MNDMAKLLFGAALGTLYLGIGFLQILLTAIGPQPGFEAFYLTGDPFSGFVLLVVGAVFGTGVWKLSRGVCEGSIFISVGVLLSLAFGLVGLFSLCAAGIGAHLVGEGAEWSIADSANPLLHLGVAGAIGFAAWGREFLRGLCAA
jgi:hypothetical protein